MTMISPEAEINVGVQVIKEEGAFEWVRPRRVFKYE